MKQEKTIIQNLIAQLNTVVNNKKVKINAKEDYKEGRQPYQVVCGVRSVQNINPGLMDYKIGLRILIDFFIKDDREGYFFKKVENQIWNYIQKTYLLTRMNLTNIEEGIVGCFLDDMKEVNDENSHQCYIDLQLIGSWDPE